MFCLIGRSPFRIITKLIENFPVRKSAHNRVAVLKLTRRNLQWLVYKQSFLLKKKIRFEMISALSVISIVPKGPKDSIVRLSKIIPHKQTKLRAIRSLSTRFEQVHSMF